MQVQPEIFGEMVGDEFKCSAGWNDCFKQGVALCLEEYVGNQLM